ncbi:MAG: tetratricopeptide repeat protein, partial [Terriglobia bacterium]
TSPGVADTLAVAYYQKGDYSLAAELVEEALKKAPNDPDLNYHMGLIYQHQQNKAKAAEYLERVLKLDPGYASAGEIRKTLATMGNG